MEVDVRPGSTDPLPHPRFLETEGLGAPVLAHHLHQARVGDDGRVWTQLPHNRLHDRRVRPGHGTAGLKVELMERQALDERSLGLRLKAGESRITERSVLVQVAAGHGVQEPSSEKERFVLSHEGTILDLPHAPFEAEREVVPLSLKER